MLLLSHPIVDCAVRHTAHALSRAGVLGEFWTWFRTPDRLLLQCVEPESMLEDPPFFDGPVDAAAGGVSCAIAPASTVAAAACSLDHAMSTRIDRERFGGVYAYEDGADATFRAAGRHGLLRIYDLPRGYWRGANPILTEEALREPEWAPTLGAEGDTPDAVARSESELAQADLVLVGSSFGLQTIEQAAEVQGAVAIMPPRPPGLLSPPRMPRLAPARSSGPLRVLFAGPLGQRSGLSYLFRACRELGPAVTLTVIGDVPSVRCPRLERELLAVRWLPGSNIEFIRQEMAEHDVFLYPAIFDGSSELLLLAMTMGLPIIATRNTAAPDLIRDGEDGFIVPLRSAAHIAEKLELLRREPARRHEMSISVRERAREFSWERFEKTVGVSVAAALGLRSPA